MVVGVVTLTFLSIFISEWLFEAQTAPAPAHKLSHCTVALLHCCYMTCRESYEVFFKKCNLGHQLITLALHCLQQMFDTIAMLLVSVAKFEKFGENKIRKIS